MRVLLVLARDLLVALSVAAGVAVLFALIAGLDPIAAAPTWREKLAAFVVAAQDFYLGDAGAFLEPWLVYADAAIASLISLAIALAIAIGIGAPLGFAAGRTRTRFRTAIANAFVGLSYGLPAFIFAIAIARWSEVTALPPWLGGIVGSAGTWSDALGGFMPGALAGIIMIGVVVRSARVLGTEIAAAPYREAAERFGIPPLSANWRYFYRPAWLALFGRMPLLASRSTGVLLLVEALTGAPGLGQIIVAAAIADEHVSLARAGLILAILPVVLSAIVYVLRVAVDPLKRKPHLADGRVHAIAPAAFHERGYARLAVLGVVAIAAAALIYAPSFAELDTVSRDIVAATAGTLATAAWATVAGGIIGGLAGVAFGFLRGPVSPAMRWLVAVIGAVPGLLTAVLIAGVAGPSLGAAALGVAVTLGTNHFRAMNKRGAQLHGAGFVKTARIGGLSSLAVLRRHVIPNTFDEIVVRTSQTLGPAILAIAALGALGLAARGSERELGAMLMQHPDGSQATLIAAAVLTGLLLAALALARRRLAPAMGATS